ncbi:hypothetical protein OUZ56_027675 [Daphnia magna]|uniref:Uncharacterized protein n=1 Tax=Daphnia magna TaxID=35525 RepID=A0ABR0B1K6_9CRUS|nr:hypothetical protein OUZ56_027675 [Daphnia magna]
MLKHRGPERKNTPGRNSALATQHPILAEGDPASIDHLCFVSDEFHHINLKTTNAYKTESINYSTVSSIGEAKHIY